MRAFARGIFFAVLLIGVFVASAKADTVYSYVGDTFRFVQGVYTQVDRITGSFVLSGSFVPVAVTGPQLVTNGVVSYNFTDGHETLTQSNSTGTFRVGFFNGTLVVPGTAGANGWWVVDLHTPTSGIVTDSIGDYQMISWIGGATPSAYHACNSGTALCYDDPTISTDTILGLDNRAPGLPGTWTVQRVPEGGTTALFLFAGLACLTILPRFIGVKRATHEL